jgi:hypothetical protein
VSARPARPRARALAALCLALAACGYSAGYRPGAGRDSVGVELFGNDSPLIDLERALHAELTAALRDRVDAPLAAPSDADLVVRGVIRDYRRRGGIRSRTNELLETGAGIEVHASLWDRRAGKELRSVQIPLVSVGYVRGDPLEPANEREARAAALHNIAGRIVPELFAGLD